MSEPPNPPRAFISYAWTSESHRARVREWAERLVEDGVEVILDQWDLREGHDATAFMERTVTDKGVTHVLMICDRTYAEKADARKAGVGTETQLISKKVYDQVRQEKFIPILCELSDEGRPVLPAYLGNRIGIDFSSDEKVNANWEQLVRTLHGQPRYMKPKLGRPPAYLAETSSVPDPARRRFQELKRAVETNAASLAAVRASFLDACIEYADVLRMRSRPPAGEPGARIIADTGKLVAVRDHIVDWVLLEAGAVTPEFESALIETIERLAEVKSRPREVTSWDATWFKAHEYFAYETLLYIVAALLKRRAFLVVRRLMIANYLRPETERHGENHFFTYREFGFDGGVLQAALSPPGGGHWTSPAAELMARQAQRNDIKFFDLIESDFLIFFNSLLNDERVWYPQLSHKKDRHQQFPLFVKAARWPDFACLAAVVGKQPDAEGAKQIQQKVKDVLGKQRMWGDFWTDDLLRLMNLDAFSTLP